MPLAEQHTSPMILARSYELAALVAAMLFMLACNATARLGPDAIVFRHIVGLCFVALVVGVLGHRLLKTANPRITLRQARASLPLLAAFCLVVGVGRPANHALMFAQMAGDFWHGDPFFAFTRRPALSALAHLLGVSPRFYMAFWALIFFLFAASVDHYLKLRGLSALERLSLLSSSIAAFLIIVPGYNEAFVFLLALWGRGAQLSTAEKIVTAAVMIGAHEMASLFAAAFIVGEVKRGDRLPWTFVFSVLYVAYATGFAANWGLHVAAGLALAMTPTPHETTSSLQWVLLRPWRWVTGIVVAYKLFWIILPLAASSWRQQGFRLACVLAALPLTLIATDTSRLMQFGSLSFLFLMADMLPTLPPRRRLLLVSINLAVPSLYVATNSAPVVGRGLYMVLILPYILVAHIFGLPPNFALS